MDEKTQVELLKKYPHMRHIYCLAWDFERQQCSKGLTLP